MPKGAGAATVGNFLAAGPSSGSPATLTFTAPVKDVSFLWGSPDLYDLLTVTTTAGTQTYVADPSLANAAAASPASPRLWATRTSRSTCEFVAQGDSSILSLRFDNAPSIDAFESSNYRVTLIPEPETYALMLAGLGVVGLVARRRRAV